MDLGSPQHVWLPLDLSTQAPLPQITPPRPLREGSVICNHLRFTPLSLFTPAATVLSSSGTSYSPISRHEQSVQRRMRFDPSDPMIVELDVATSGIQLGVHICAYEGF